MCGFYLYYGPHKNKKHKFNFKIPNLVRRGPDQFTKGKLGDFFFQFYRLAMVSKKKFGIQPIDIDKYRTLFFNGEIYNYKQLNEWGPKINSDTELLSLYIAKYGLAKTLQNIDGMYAIVILNKMKKNIKLIRDFPGIKPLYYSTYKNQIIISSDIMSVVKDLKTKINKKYIPENFFFRSVIPPNTIWENIYQVEQGCILSIDYKNTKKLKIKKRKFLNLEKEFENNKFKIKELDKILKNSVLTHSSSIYDPSTLLSSGIDSGLIAYYTNEHFGKLVSYSAFFRNKNFSEKSEILKDWKNKKINYNFILDKKSISEKNLLNKYIHFKGSPITIGNEISLIKVFRKVKKKTSLILSGEGADELFLGYDRIAYFFRNISKIGKFKDKEKIKQIEKFLLNYCYFCINQNQINKIIKKLKMELFKVYKIYGWQKAYQYFFLKYHILSLLDRLDKTSMFNSVEARVPFLSQKVIRYAIKTNLIKPVNIVKNKLIGKLHLRKLAKNKIGYKFAYRPKIGFPHPVYSGFSKTFPNYKNSWLFDQYMNFTKIIK